MKSIALWSYYTDLFYNGNVLNNSDAGIGDDALYGVNKLYAEAKSRNYYITTLDQVENLNNLDLIICFDYPRPFKNYKDYVNLKKIESFKKFKYLILHECDVIKKNNWQTSNHKNWDKIFTWNDQFIDNKKYFKLNMSPRKNINIQRISFDKKKFSTIICSNKFFSHPNQLFSERLNCINFFEKNCPNDLDLYGVGWEKKVFDLNNFFIRKLNHLSFLFPYKEPSVWHGPIDKKKDVLPYYKFNFVFENSKNLQGYILEKIFDSFICKSVPIYFGASNITDYIPEDCFIDLRKFQNYSSLYHYLSSMKSYNHDLIIDKIENYLESESYKNNFHVNKFTSILLNHIKSDLG